MCGISGIYHYKNSKRVAEGEIKKMNNTLIHRGPDDEGIYVSEDKKAGLGTRRLKIIDLSPAGHMPMSTGGVWITYNGEVYNFRELRSELEGKGFKFKSRTDTEVILNSYLEYGFDCVKKFNGMFAFAIYDEKKKLLFAARDHVGIKPFYYAVKNGSFYFGSEIKAILAHPDIKKELNEDALSYYLTFASTPAPHTLFSGIQKLAPAHYLVIKDGEIEKRKYWNPVADAPEQNKSEGYLIDEIRELLEGSIKAQMVSDVPFGCFLSGGIDSSLNATLMSRALGKPVETFSVGSEVFKKYNEFEYSRKVAGLLGAKTHEILVTEKHLLEFLEKFPYYADDLNGDQVCVLLYWLAKLTRESGVIMIQVGEGSDELFAGYPTYLLANKLYRSWWRWLEKIPDSLKKLLYKSSSILSRPRFNFHKEYLRRLALHQEPFWGNAVAFSEHEKQILFTPEFRKRLSGPTTYSFVENFYKEIGESDSQADFLKRLTYLEIRNRLPELLLARVDKMTMAHSVEARVPFLDRRIVELSLQIPADLKLKGDTTKYVLKKAAQGIIPEEIIWRKKQGFAAPMSEWLKPESAVSKELINVIYNSKIKERSIFNYKFIDQLIHSHQRQGVEHNFRIWNLIALSLWYDYWF